MKLHGKNGQIYINGTLFAYGTGYQIEVDRDFANVSVLGDAAQVWAGGLRGFSGTFEGLYNTDGNPPMVAAFLDAVAVAFYSPWPVGFFVSTFGFAVYTGAAGVRMAATLRGRSGHAAPPLGGPAAGPVPTAVGT